MKKRNKKNILRTFISALVRKLGFRAKHATRNGHERSRIQVPPHMCSHFGIDSDAGTSKDDTSSSLIESFEYNAVNFPKIMYIPGRRAYSLDDQTKYTYTPSEDRTKRPSINLPLRTTNQC